MTDNNSLNLREIILNARKPLVFRKFPFNWSCFQNGLEEWCKKFDGTNIKPTRFERMAKTDDFEPQWERKRTVLQMTAMQFLEEHNKDCDYWSALNYKRIAELPPQCTTGIDFSQFGFPHVGDDATLWLCSSNANTPCHCDSYGCNIVVQVFGMKSWHLFPPNAPLTTTRIPYEESSIYCKENFYSPNEDMMKNIATYKGLVYQVVLEPNDVLIVPKHWWHYVEAVNISLSVNAWIPLKCDLDQQIGECIVKYFIENVVKNSSLESKTLKINPNQLANFATKDELFKVLKYLLDECLKKCSIEKTKIAVYDYHYLNEIETEKLITQSKNIESICPLASKELEHFLKPRSTHPESSIEKNSIDVLEEILINSICSPNVIELIKNELIKHYKGENEM